MDALVTVILLALAAGLLYTLATGRNPVQALAVWIGEKLANVFFGRVPGERGK